MISATRSRSPRRENRLVPRRRRRPRPPAAAVHHPGTFRASLDVLVPVGLPGTDGTGSAATAGLHRPGRRPGRRQCSPGEAVMTLLAPTLQTFFTDRLMRQLGASGHTIRSYRASWRLLLLFAAAQKSKAPSALDFADLDPLLITCFLDHLEHQRGNTARTRNLRLAAIHSMFAYAAPLHPEHAGDIARVLAIPGKRFRTTVIIHLAEEEIAALLDAPDSGTWTGRRDHALMLVAITTGLRAGRPHPCRHPPRRRPPRGMSRQGQEEPGDTFAPGHRRRPGRMAQRKPRRTRRPPLPAPARHADEPGRHRRLRQPPRRPRRAHLPHPGRQAPDTPRPQAHLRN